MVAELSPRPEQKLIIPQEYKVLWDSFKEKYQITGERWRVILGEKLERAFPLAVQKYGELFGVRMKERLEGAFYMTADGLIDRKIPLEQTMFTLLGISLTSATQVESGIKPNLYAIVEATRRGGYFGNENYGNFVDQAHNKQLEHIKGLLNLGIQTLPAHLRPSKLDSEQNNPL